MSKKAYIKKRTVLMLCTMLLFSAAFVFMGCGGERFTFCAGEHGVIASSYQGRVGTNSFRILCKETDSYSFGGGLTGYETGNGWQSGPHVVANLGYEFLGWDTDISLPEARAQIPRGHVVRALWGRISYKIYLASGTSGEVEVVDSADYKAIIRMWNPHNTDGIRIGFREILECTTTGSITSFPINTNRFGRDREKPENEFIRYQPTGHFTMLTANPFDTIKYFEVIGRPGYVAATFNLRIVRSFSNE